MSKKRFPSRFEKARAGDPERWQLRHSGRSARGRGSQARLAGSGEWIVVVAAADRAPAIGRDGADHDGGGEQALGRRSSLPAPGQPTVRGRRTRPG